MKQFGEAIERATAYCTYCPKLCRFSCPVAEAERRETVTPWGLMRLLEFTRTGDVELDKEVAETFYHCTGCARCQTWCEHDNDVTAAMWAARARARDEGIVPDALQGFEIEFMRYSAPEQLPTMESALVQQCFDQNAAWGYFPDCSTRLQPEKVASVGVLLERLLGKKVRLITRLDGEGVGCCGAPLLAAGDHSSWLRHHASLKRSLENVRVLITDCSSMVAQWREPARWGANLQRELPELKHIIKVFDEKIPEHPPEARLEQQSSKIFEGCLVSRHLELSDAMRRVLEHLFDSSPDDLHESHDQETCCGAHGLYPKIDPAGSAECAKTLVEQVEREHGEALVCGSSQCSRHIREKGGDEHFTIDLIEAACLAYEIELSES